MRKALSDANRFPGFPTLFLAIVWLYLDRYDPPGWVWGVALTLCGLYAIACIIDMWRCERVNLEEVTKP